MKIRAVYGRNVALAMLCWLVFGAGVSAQTLETSLSMASEPREYVGNGQSYLYTPADGTFAAQKNFYNGVSLSFIAPGYVHSWYLIFVAPNGQPLTVGTYIGAVREGAQGPDQPGFDIYGDGRGCNAPTGRFEVKQIEYGSGTTITAFWAVFEQYCGGGFGEIGVPVLFGEIRYNADVGLVVTAPFNQSIGRLQPLTFNVSAVDLASYPVALTATDLPAGATFTDHGDNTGTLSWTPNLDQLGVYLVTFHGNDGHGGTNTAATQISVTGVTALVMTSEPGDFVGDGQSYFYTPIDGWFTAQGGLINTVSLSFSTPAFLYLWNLVFAAPNNQSLAVGTYTGAVVPGVQGPGQPGLDILGNGRGCNTLAGQFEVKQIEYGAGTTITAFWAMFEQHCEVVYPPLIGEILFNADGRIAIAAPNTISISAGQPLTVPVAATDPMGLPVTLTAVDLPTGATFTDHGDKTGTLEWTPGLGQIGAHTVIFNGTDAQRYAGSVMTRITVLSPPPDLTGSWLGLGQVCKGGSSRTKLRCVLNGDFNIENPSLYNAGNTVTRFYLSNAPVWNRRDRIIGQAQSGAVASGATESIHLHAQLPSRTTASGQYVIAVVDATNTVSESDETNNVIVYGPIP